MTATRDLAEAARAIVARVRFDGLTYQGTDDILNKEWDSLCAALASHDAQRGEGEPYIEWCAKHAKCERVPGPFCPACVMLREYAEGQRYARKAHDKGTCHRTCPTPTRAALERVAREAVRLAEACFGHVYPLPVEEIITRAVEAGKDGE